MIVTLFRYLCFILIFNYLLIGCSTSKSSVETNRKDDIESPLLYATLYNCYAAEYKALSLQAYNLAKERLMSIRMSDPGEANFAVVLDLDETVLDNSPYQAKLIADNIQYDSLWNEWCLLENAEAVPGALDFCLLADSLDFNLFYLSNRKEKFVREATIENLRKLGFPQLNPENIILRSGSSSKESRRMEIAQNYEIVLFVGDNLGDFYEDAGSSATRDSVAFSNQEEFGRRFIILPNAMYGNWVESLGLIDDPDNRTLLIDSMIRVFDEIPSKN